MKILLVEDSRTIRIENERALAQAGHEVILAEEGETALRLAREQAPDLILLDLLLPRISGIDVLRTLKGDPGTAQIPVVVVSGLSERNGEMLMAEGAVDYLEKSQVMRNRGTTLLPELLEDGDSPNSGQTSYRSCCRDAQIGLLEIRAGLHSHRE